MLLGFGLSGYRSFGETPQYLYPLKKVNVICGANNCGKSNVLRFAKSILSATLRNQSPDRRINALLDLYQPGVPVTVYLPVPIDETLAGLIGKDEATIRDACQRFNLQRVEWSRAVQKGCLWFPYRYHPGEGQRSASEPFTEVAIQLEEDLAAARRTGDQARNDLNQILRRLSSPLVDHPMSITYSSYGQYVEMMMRPLLAALHTKVDFDFVNAIRNIGDTSKEFDKEFSGAGVISYLHEIRSPKSTELHREEEEFFPIQEFTRSVLENSSAQIIIPHDASQVIVSLDGVRRPLESLGQGINQVNLLGIAATRAKGKVLCIEEPEQHLHPILQRKLLNYLSQLEGDRQFLLTTHSATILDHPGAAVFSVQLTEEGSKIEDATASKERHHALFSMGYRPSDLLQTNCVIWVEGPSDAVYLADWIGQEAPELTEGADYSFLFYGGKILAHHSLAEDEDSAESLIRCLKINRRSFLVMDSDRRSAEQEDLNDTKDRIIEEAKGEDKVKRVWVTAGKEIENYLPAGALEAYLEKNYKPEQEAKATPTDLRYGNRLTFSKKGKDGNRVDETADKVKLARWLADSTNVPPALDGVEQIKALVRFIKEAGHIFPSSAQGSAEPCETCGQPKKA